MSNKASYVENGTGCFDRTGNCNGHLARTKDQLIHTEQNYENTVVTEKLVNWPVLSCYLTNVVQKNSRTKHHRPCISKSQHSLDVVSYFTKPPATVTEHRLTNHPWKVEDDSDDKNGYTEQKISLFAPTSPSWLLSEVPLSGFLIRRM